MRTTTALTAELRELVDNGVDLWNFEYPSYYEGELKKAFEQKVIDHYYFRQIGQETVGRFLHMFRTRVRELMPYYIDLYRSVEIMHGLENPFDNVDIVETFMQETTGSSSGETSGSLTGNTTGESTTSDTVTGTTSATGNSSDAETKKEDKTTTESKLKKFSNTPQNYVGNLDHFMTEATVEENTLTDGVTGTGSVLKEFSENGSTSNTSEGSVSTESNSSETSSATSSQETSGTVKHTLTRKGNQGVNTFAHDIIEFRKSIINVDLQFINELNDLFLGVY